MIGRSTEGLDNGTGDCAVRGRFQTVEIEYRQRTMAISDIQCINSLIKRNRRVIASTYKVRFKVLSRRIEGLVCVLEIMIFVK